MRANVLLASALFVCAVPAFSQTNVSVNLPSPGTTVGIPFTLQASGSPCSGQTLASMGYSIDYGATTVVYANSINTQVTTSAGPHTLHVKSWGNQGAGCDTDVPITVSAQATNINVSQPTTGAKLVSPFTLTASGSQCQSQAVVAFGYSIDNSSSTSIVPGSSVNATVTSALGAHTLHVKTWGNQGAGCVTDIPINVVPSPVSQLPSNAIAVSGIQTLVNWQASLDSATGANTATSGVSSLNNSPSISGTSRKFLTSSANDGGERYWVEFGADTSVSNFLYDGWFYLTGSANNIANLEFDMNQVMANGQTVIYGFQCDSWTGTWDYTMNAGSPENYSDKWVHSASPCNVRNWQQNTWHHLQISYSRDDYGNVTYHTLWFDNVEQDLNATVPDAYSLGWGSTLLTNFQVDGMTSGSSDSTVYMDNLTIYRW